MAETNKKPSKKKVSVYPEDSLRTQMEDVSDKARRKVSDQWCLAAEFYVKFRDMHGDGAIQKLLEQTGQIQ